MDKIKFGLFDIFVYAIPGLFVVFALYLLKSDMSITVLDLGDKVAKIVNTFSFNIILLILFISYISGFVLHYFGYIYFNRVGKRIWKKSLKNKEHSLSTNEKKLALVRHFSKENFLYVEQWYTLRGMSFNLSLIFMLIGIVLLMKMIFNLSFKFDWSMVVAGSFFLSFVTLNRAITFHIWSYDTIEETITSLKLLND